MKVRFLIQQQKLGSSSSNVKSKMRQLNYIILDYEVYAFLL